ncbi:MAG TPA: peptidase S10 [Planctomycetota bacterium]|nr:peptidase S10 [Planctomycetota bacterium]
MIKHSPSMHLVLLAVLSSCAMLRAEPQSEPSREASGKPDAKAACTEHDAACAPQDQEPPLSVTAHTIEVGGRTLKYHATAGYLLLKEEEGKPFPGSTAASDAPKDDESKEASAARDGATPKARVFFVAYTLDDVADPATRPLTFAFNGGPGSASIWLHMAAMAPRRAALTEDGEAPPPPYRLEDNESTWLDRTDLVFIDPVSTGYSRPVTKESPAQFHGLKEDIASVGDFIRLYTSRNARWLSPKLVLGESYGTTRAAGLSDYLQDRYGLYLNGIVLVSTVLSFQTLQFTPQNMDPYVGFLPTFAATAWYHHKLPPDLAALSLPELCARARAFAAGDYALALARGDTLPEAELARVAGQLSRFTGLPADFCAQRRLRVSDSLFFTRLLAGEGRVVGRLDSRFTGLRYEPGTDDGEYDPSSEAVAGALTAAFNDYVRRELHFETDIPYETLTDVGPWNFGDAGEGFPNTAEALRRAMTRNPYLKVWVTCSYYDVATPFFAAENSVAAMNLDPAVRRNLRFSFYESGHMLYIHQPSRVRFKADFDAFLDDAIHQEPVHAAAR